MSINVNDKNLGHATAYAYYKAGGGTMTEAEFTEFMADFGTASQTAVEAAQAALASKNAAQTAATTATNKASEATTAATTATTKAGEASTSASTATSAKDTAVSASQTATTKATEATTAAATAVSAKDDAVSANTAAQSAKTAAQTAQTGAETAAASVQSSAEQIATNTEDIESLKSDLSDANAELADLRVGADGTTYNSAGAAVRGQIKKVTDDTERINNNVYFTQQCAEDVKVNYDLLDNPTNGLISGFYSNASGIYVSSRTDYACSKNRMFALPSDKITIIKTKGLNVTLYVQFYDKNGTFVSASDAINLSATNPNQKSISVPNNCYWFNISINHQYMVNINPSDYAVSVYVNRITYTTEDTIKNGGSIKYITPTSDDFFQGLYGSNSIIETSGTLASTQRIGLITPIKCKAGTNVDYTMYSDHQLSIKIFPVMPAGYAQTALQESTWLTGENTYKLNYDGYLILNLRRSSDGVIAPADYASTVVLPKFENFDYINKIEEDITDLRGEITGVGSSPYYGEKIKLDAYHYQAEQIGSVAVDSHVPQSSAIFGDELFTMYTGGDSTKTKFSVYDLLTNTVSGIFYMDSDTPYLHCNSACFSNKQNSNDDYPLLYVNSYMDNNVGKGVCFVEKIIKDGTDYTTEQIQRISIDFADQEIWTGKTMNPSTLAAGNWIVDTVGNRLIAYTTQGFERTRFFIFELPDVSESNVILTQNDILDYFDVSYIANIQDSCLHNGMIYMTSGIDWGDYDRILRIYAINLSGRCIVSSIKLEEAIPAMRTEPEGIDYYDGSLIVTMVTKRVMKLTF